MGAEQLVFTNKPVQIAKLVLSSNRPENSQLVMDSAKKVLDSGKGNVDTALGRLVKTDYLEEMTYIRSKKELEIGKDLPPKRNLFLGAPLINMIPNFFRILKMFLRILNK